jgi:predicted HD superfamily hydrolase involved in NAD metabolism
MDINRTILRVDEYIVKNLSARRIAHSRSAAAFARDLSARWSIDPSKAYLAGLSHDMAKGLSKDELGDFLRKSGKSLDPIYHQNPSFLHGPAAELMLKRDFGVDEKDILEAVRLHTLGEPGMSPLAILIYCADKIEPERAHSGPELLEKCIKEDLNETLLAVLEDLFEYFRRKAMPVAPQTLSLYNSLRKQE